MEIVVRGKNVPIDHHLRDLSTEKLEKLERFASDMRRIEVEFSEVRNPRVSQNQICEVTVHLKGHLVKAHAAASEAPAALDLVVDKVEHQVSRLKEKRVGRSHPRRRRPTAHTLPPELFEEREESNGDASPDSNGGRAEIVRSKQFTMKPMAIDEAALQMDLLGHDFYLFTNADTGRANVLYRRRDGHLGLIEAIG